MKRNNLVNNLNIGEYSTKSALTALMLLLTLPILGLHRFYAGRPFSGVLYVCTIAGLGTWWLYDLYALLFSRFKDGDGDLISFEQ